MGGLVAWEVLANKNQTVTKVSKSEPVQTAEKRKSECLSSGGNANEILLVAISMVKLSCSHGKMRG